MHFFGVVSRIHTQHDHGNIAPICPSSIGIEQAKIDDALQPIILSRFVALGRHVLNCIEHQKLHLFPRNYPTDTTYNLAYSSERINSSVIFLDGATMDVRILVGTNIGRLRRERGLSQEQFCELAGVTQSYLSQIENGHVNLGLLGLNDIAAAFGIHPRRLLDELIDPSEFDDHANNDR